jgi:hypothetical protein
MHSLIIPWCVYPLLVSLILSVATKIFELPPKIKPLSPEEWAPSAEYHHRMNRRGVYTPKKYAAVVSIERVWR